MPLLLIFIKASNHAKAQQLTLNKFEYFERQVVNVQVYSNLFAGGFHDEKNVDIELIHHGVRKAQGVAVSLSNTTEQWDLVPEIPIRKVDQATKNIESLLRYKEYDFDLRVVVTAKGNGMRSRYGSMSRSKPLQFTG